MSTAWQRITEFPCHTDKNWAIWKRGKATSVEFETIKKMVAHWNPTSKLLVASPDCQYFVPPICLPIFESKIQRHLSNNLKFAFISLLFFSFLLLGVAVYRHSLPHYSFFALTIWLSLTIYADYRIGWGNVTGASERAKFFSWLQISKVGRLGFAFWSALSILIGVAQWMLFVYFGDWNTVLERFSFVFANFANGEYWRLPIGFIFHGNLIHFLNNAFLLVFIGVISWAILGAKISIGSFLLGNWTSLLAQMIWVNWWGHSGDACWGMSGGIFSLLGLVVISATFDRQILPKGFLILLVNVFLMTSIVSEILSSRTATVAHIAGFGTGLALGCLGATLGQLRR
ncbi:MAG: rhomboid family intramembrane serine protease [Betaproteobacteria bacterium]|nr:rhomboid family intramembrane serine protease [Betaproteobacteria bacterium]